MPVDTAGQQPAVFKMSVESFAAAEVQCDLFAGHSLGSYAALVAAGAVDAQAAEQIVTLRGRVMADAAEQHPGGMVALLGTTIEAANELAEKFELTVANDNAPGQIVLSGTNDGIEALEASEPTITDDEGNQRRLRLKRLPVSGGFHSPLITEASGRLAEALAEVEFGDASLVIANGTARPYSDPRSELPTEMLAPVRFRESLLHMWDLGVREFVEFEPAGVLTGLVKRTLPDATAIKIGNLASAGRNPS
ncbi:MAG: ACP S-malonyltransferase [Solirubrobacterales bacterium]